MQVFLWRKKQKNDGRKQIDLAPNIKCPVIGFFSAMKTRILLLTMSMTIEGFQQKEELSMSIMATTMPDMLFRVSTFK